MKSFKLEKKEYLSIDFEKNGSFLNALIEEETIYLNSFSSIIENRGYMQELLKEALEDLKYNYPNHGIYADCNIHGMVVSLKCGGQIRKDIFRIDF